MANNDNIDEEVKKKMVPFEKNAHMKTAAFKI